MSERNAYVRMEYPETGAKADVVRSAMEVWEEDGWQAVEPGPATETKADPAPATGTVAQPGNTGAVAPAQPLAQDTSSDVQPASSTASTRGSA